jgi:hypothetical protein
MSWLGMSWLDISGFGGETGSPLASSHRFINFISSDCDWLIRAPSSRISLFSVCDSMSAVISTACAWCMIIPCMNSTSFGERGGSVALVSGGSVRVGWPGAPGCTTTGGLGDSACCAQTGSDKKHVRAQAAISPLRGVATLMTERSLSMALKVNDFIGVD